jgi:histidine triad (HIT) family protein
MRAPMCSFCRIVEGILPAARVGETAHSLAIRDIDPHAPTHVLVLPKRHLQHIAELVEEPEELADLFRLAADVAADEGLERGYRIVTNTGSEGGQTVYHAHLHLFGGRRMVWPPG